jgi:ribose-phosphate pyrophosphokinase
MIINLVDPEKSSIKYHISTFPDGQINVHVQLHDLLNREVEYKIVSRFSSYTDLIKILATNQVLRNAGVKYVELFCPYILSSRSDKRFHANQSFDLKLTSQLLNTANFDKVVICDPHSGITEALINNSLCITSYNSWVYRIPNDFWENKVLISPDAGAFKKVFDISEQLGLDLISGSKVRNHETRELRTIVHGNVIDRECVIIDDICDGGRTFVQLAKQLKDLGAKTVSLLVTHGIFSNGLVLEGIDEIWTTNSYRDFTDVPNNFNVLNIFP